MAGTAGSVPRLKADEGTEWKDALAWWRHDVGGHAVIFTQERIERPPCPKCGASMLLTRIVPKKLGINQVQSLEWQSLRRSDRALTITRRRTFRRTLALALGR